MNYYFIGIGGIGMSALARFFKQRGDTVSGYDRTPSALTRQLEAEGIAVHYIDAPHLVPTQVDLAIYTPAVPHDLAELQLLRQRGVKIMKRSQVLGELTRGKLCIAVAGSHGKTTTSTLVAHLMHVGGVGCSAFLGGISKNFGSNLVVDTTGQYVVVEADEYDRSFLQLHPHIAVITATDPDHLDIYGTHEAMLDAYSQFASQTAADGHLLLRQGIFRTADGRQYVGSADGTMPFNASVQRYTAHGTGADYYATNISTTGGNLVFDIHTPQGAMQGLQMCGAPLVNVENAVAAVAVAAMCGVSDEAIRLGLKTFAGVKRRFDIRINQPHLVYIDDYAHHPAEIASTIDSVRYLYPGKRVVGVFQPHLYSRTRDFALQFAQALQSLDAVVLMPIYPAREQPIEGVTSSMLLGLINNSNKYLCTPEQVLQLVPTLAPDVVLTLGAGDIDRLVPSLAGVLNQHAL